MRADLKRALRDTGSGSSRSVAVPAAARRRQPPRRPAQPHANRGSPSAPQSPSSLSRRSSSRLLAQARFAESRPARTNSTGRRRCRRASISESQRRYQFRLPPHGSARRSRHHAFFHAWPLGSPVRHHCQICEVRSSTSSKLEKNFTSAISSRGHYQKVGKQLQLTLEAIDVAGNSSLWIKLCGVPG